jgi:methyl-accepting chemotaxis protein
MATMSSAPDQSRSSASNDRATPRRGFFSRMRRGSRADRIADYEGQLAAINKAQAVIEFTLDGTILYANENFLKATGYTLAEIRGKHHSIFAEPAYRQSRDYQLFWEKLGRGEYDAGQYKRLGKNGKEIWIQASYNPIFDSSGKAFKVVKYATDVTAQVLANEALRVAIQQIQDVIAAVKGDDLSKRIPLNGKTGEVHDLCAGVNGLVETMGKAVGDIRNAGVALQAALAQTQDVITAAKDNNLTLRIPMDGKTGDVEALCAGVNALLDTMTGVVAEIKVAAREVTNASAEISTSTTDLSQRTEEQAASLEETSASMEEILATVKKNAENAQQANRSAAETQEVAARSGQVVGNAVDAMARIEGSSRKISDIIGVIDEIARQTNLLALNAAVEAARAGEAGRGFAVVASEVRSLAQRSSQAAKDIKDLITNSNDQVKSGVDLVNRAGSALTEIVESIKKVAGIVADIAHASAEQASGIEQVNKALTQMDEVTQQNSALVEENAATAKTLEHQAKAMNDRVAVFEIDDSISPVTMAAAAPAREDRPVRAAAAKSAAVKPQAPARRGSTALNGGGPVRRMQTALARAVEHDQDWQEF